MTASTVETSTSPVQVGDFFYRSWGYDQTNVDFYKVVGVTKSGKSVKVQEWTTATVANHVSQDEVVPGSGPVKVKKMKSGVTQDEYYAMDFWDRQDATEEVDGPVSTHRVKVWGDTVAFTVNSYSSAYKWDGRPQYATASGWGH